MSGGPEVSGHYPSRPLSPATIAVVAGRGSGEPGEPLNQPVVLASNFRAASAGAEPVADYARGGGNPSWTALEDAIGLLEGGSAVSFSSGVAAIAAVLDLVPNGGRVVLPSAAYTGTRRLAGHLETKGLMSVELVDVTDTAGTIASAAQAAMLWLESPTNPMLGIADLDAIITGARGSGATVVVDNTLATPLLQRPLGLGADIVVHSVTKYLSGHSDLLAGAVVSRDLDLVERIRSVRALTGSIPGAMDAYLALRGLRTLPVRLHQAQASAGVLAERLEQHRMIARVRYPGLKSDPANALAAKQMDGFGAMVSFEVVGGGVAADRVCASTRLIVHSTSLGGVESLIERRNKVQGEEHVPEGLVRLSVGCEDVEDLWDDLDQALTQGR